MKKKKSVVLVCSQATKEEVSKITGPFIGVDRGAYLLATLKQTMIVAVGDFDSVATSDMTLIERWSKKTMRLNPHKNETDTEVALTYALQQGFNDVLIVGGLGGRFDHSFANVMLLLRHHQEGCVLQDTHQRIQVLTPGVYDIQKYHFKYLSFFTLQAAVFSASGVKYPFVQKKLLLGDIDAISNEIIDKQARIVVQEGLIVMMQTRD
jgi:thiamine pyrophosphokinase